MRPPHPKLYDYFHSNSQSPDLHICSLFSCYCPFFTFVLLFVTCICRQRSKVSNTYALRLSLFFCLLWSPPPPFSYLSILPRMAIYGFLLDSVGQTASFKQGKGTHVQKKWELCRLAKSWSVQCLHSVYKIAKNSIWKQTNRIILILYFVLALVIICQEHPW